MNKFFLMFLCVFMVGFITAVPPVTSEFTGNTGLDLEANFQDYYKINEGAEIHIYVFNITTGSIVNTSEVDCFIEMTDRNGTVKLSGSPTPDGDHYHMIRPSTVLTETGVYAVTVVCNGTDIAGYKTAYFEATESGIAHADDIFLTVLLILCFFMFGATIYVSLKTFEKGVNLEIDLNDVVKSFTSFGLFLLYYWFVYNYWGDTFLMSLLEVTLWIVGFMNLMVVSIMFGFSILKRLGDQR